MKKLWNNLIHKMKLRRAKSDLCWGFYLKTGAWPYYSDEEAEAYIESDMCLHEWMAKEYQIYEKIK